MCIEQQFLGYLSPGDCEGLHFQAFFVDRVIKFFRREHRQLQNAMGPCLHYQARIRALLKSHAVLGRLPDGVLDGLLHKGQLKKYAKGEAVYRRGDPGDSLMVLVNGGIKLTIISVQAKEVVVHFVALGETFGEISALDGKARALNAVALEASEVFAIRARDLMPAFAAHPNCLTEQVRSLCGKMRVGTLLIENRTLVMEARVARSLLGLARHLGRRRKDGIHLQLAASQEELGNYLGLSRANVSRQLGQLRKAGVIRIDEAGIVITDERGLARTAEAELSKT
jgi:CRP-like cAMP-binding protein